MTNIYKIKIKLLSEQNKQLYKNYVKNYIKNAFIVIISTLIIIFFVKFWVTTYFLKFVCIGFLWHTCAS